MLLAFIEAQCLSKYEIWMKLLQYELPVYSFSFRGTGAECNQSGWVCLNGVAICYQNAVAQLKQYDWITTVWIVFFARLFLILKKLPFLLAVSAPANADSAKK